MRVLLPAVFAALLCLPTRAAERDLLLQVFHSGNVFTAAFSPAGDAVYTGGADHKVMRWNLASGLLERTWSFPESTPLQLGFLPDGRLVVGLSNGRLHVAEDVAGTRFRAIGQEGASGTLSDMTVLPDGKRVLVSRYDRFSVVNIETGKVEREVIDEEGFQSGGTASPDGKYAAIPMKRGFTRGRGGPLRNISHTVGVYDLATGTQSTPFVAPQEANRLAFSRDGLWLYGVSTNHRSTVGPTHVFVWNAKTRALHWTLPMPDRVDGLAPLADGSFVTVCQGALSLWSPQTKSLVASLGSSSAAKPVASRDGTMVALTSAVFKPGRLELWDVAQRREVRAWSARLQVPKRLAALADGRHLVVAGDTTHLWDLQLARPVRELDAVWVRDFLTPRSGELIGFTHADPNSGQPETRVSWQHRIAGEHPPELTVGVSAAVAWDDAKQLVYGANGEGLHLWRQKKGQWKREKSVKLRLREFDAPFQLALNASGDRLAMGTRFGDVLLFDAAKRTMTKRLGRHDEESLVMKLAFAPNNRFLVTGNQQGSVLAWELASGKKHVLTSKKHKYSNMYTMALAVSPDSQFVAASGDSAEISIFESGKWTSRGQLQGHAYGVTDLRFTTDGKYLISLAGDGAMKLWDFREGKEVATFLLVGASDYLVYTPDGYYLASKGALRSVAFREGNTAYPFEQFDLIYNRPDIVLQRIGYAPATLIDALRRSALKRMERMGFPELKPGDTLQVPHLELVTNVPLSTTQSSVKLKLKASDAVALLDRVNVHVNDVPLHGQKGISLRERKSSKYEGEVEIPLGAGVNKVQVSVLNDRGVESLKQTITITQEKKAVKRLFVLAIGVSDYADDAFDLTYAAKDANDLAAFLQKTKGLFESVQVKRLVDAEATRDGVLKARPFLEQASVDDVVVLFIAGHGLVDEQLDYYFATADVNFDRPAERGLPYDALEGLLDGLSARRKLLLMDTCHAGEIDKSAVESTASGQRLAANVKARAVGTRGLKVKKPLGGDALSALLSEYFADLRRGSGAAVLASSGGAEYALESSEFRNGVFTFALLEGLRDARADKDNDRTVRVSEARDFVIERVRALTGGQQTPTARRENLELDFELR